MSRVVIAFAHPGEVSGAFCDSLLKTIIYDNSRPAGCQRILTKGGGYVQVSSGPRIAAARNLLVAKFLDEPAYEDAEWLWMLDSDMTFESDILDHLLAAAYPHGDEGMVAPERHVIGGLCFGGGRGAIFPTIYTIVDPAANDGVPVLHVTDWPENALIKCDATGAACLLIHRSVLEKMREAFDGSPVPWFAESVYKGQEFGEDWTFCLRVAQLGFDVWVNTQAKTGHVKTMVMDESLWRTGKVPLQFLGGVPRETVVTDPMENKGNRAERRRRAKGK